jgi:hypothetical protein
LLPSYSQGVLRLPDKKSARSAAVSELQKFLQQSDVNNLGKASCSTPRVALKT